MIKKWYSLLRYMLCACFLSQTHISTKYTAKTSRHLMPHIIDFDQLPTHANNASFKKSTSLPDLSLSDLSKIINSYSFIDYQNACTYKNVAFKHKINLKKKRISYTLACKY